MLTVVVKDIDAFQKLYDSRLAAMPGVQRLTSTPVMKDVIPRGNCPCCNKKPATSAGKQHSTEFLCGLANFIITSPR